jgi:hypothetical protein
MKEVDRVPAAVEQTEADAQPDKDKKALQRRIKDLEKQVAALTDKVDDLKDTVACLEGEAANRDLRRLATYRSVLADLDWIFGLRNLPISLRFQLESFEALL